jgi:hypothetical protein
VRTTRPGRPPRLDTIHVSAARPATLTWPIA